MDANFFVIPEIKTESHQIIDKINFPRIKKLVMPRPQRKFWKVEAPPADKRFTHSISKFVNRPTNSPSNVESINLKMKNIISVLIRFN